MKFCPNCGTKIDGETPFCQYCGANLKEAANNAAAQATEAQSPVDSGTYTQPSETAQTNTTATGTAQKSKLAAGLLGIFLGSLGVHNFYLGYTGKAVAQLLLTLIGWILCGIGPAAAAIWGLIEGIMILTGEIKTDANGNPLKD